MALLHQENRQFLTVIDMRAIEVQPQDNDKFFCEETNLDYDYDPTLTADDDGLYIIALDNFPGRFQSIDGGCPKTIVEYNNHALMGRTKPTQVFGFILEGITFPKPFDIFVSDNGNSSSVSLTLNNLGELATNINAILATFPNTSTFAASTTDSGKPMIYTGAFYNNVQIGIRDGVSGVWYTGGSLDPESDGLDGQIPYLITVGNNSKCEGINIIDGVFNPNQDKILIKKPAGVVIPSNYIPFDFGQTINAAFGTTNATDTYIHTFYAVDGGTAMDSVNMLTLAVPFNNATDSGIIATDVTQVQAAINVVLPSMGYTANEAIYTILNNNEIAIWYSPALAAAVTSGDFLHMYAGPVSTPGGYTNKVDFTNQLSISQLDVQLPLLGTGNLRWGSLPNSILNPFIAIPSPIISLENWQEPQHANNGGSPPPWAANNIKILVRYPENYSDFETLVATGNVRLQLQHLDGKAVSRKTDHATIIDKKKHRMVWRWAIHKNGTMDSGDYLFGGICVDSSGNLYPDRDTMLYLSNTTKPNQFFEFELNPSLWYGYGAASFCGNISTSLPMKYEDYLSSNLTVLCGGKLKYNFNNKTKEVVDRKYFRFVFMYKNTYGRWVQSLAPSQVFYVDFKLANVDDGDGNIQKWIIGFRSRFA